MEQEYELQSEPAKPRQLYFVGLALFLIVSLALALWAFITLLVARS